ncbi:MAG: bifunctional hydroxymethylpyrimidine kinase/phosphomethylpyrimidine kinase [Syntrophobacterales bacterium]|nr:bifunctional hydroxymethylpyrimidine kinase/phosphomethylpyrimidine kinase [Syntrophobacterales bacterium]
MSLRRIPRVMTIAGSDSGGGAGIQADLKTCSALGVYATTVVTALTAQNTLSVKGIFSVDPYFVTAQIDAIMEDIGTDAVKTGMLDRREIIFAVVESIRKWKIEKLVVDPVMVAKSGDLLLQSDAVQSLVADLLPLAYVVTPNIPEAQAILGGIVIDSLDEMKEAAKGIYKLGPRYVVLKGGHGRGEKVVDVLYDGKRFKTYESDRITSKNTHGTGCTFSAALASFLAKGMDVEEAVGKAKQYVLGAMAEGLSIGLGHRPLHHFYNCSVWER